MRLFFSLTIFILSFGFLSSQDYDIPDFSKNQHHNQIHWPDTISANQKLPYAQDWQISYIKYDKLAGKHKLRKLYNRDGQLYSIAAIYQKFKTTTTTRIEYDSLGNEIIFRDTLEAYFDIKDGLYVQYSQGIPVFYGHYKNNNLVGKCQRLDLDKNQLEELELTDDGYPSGEYKLYNPMFPNDIYIRLQGDYNYFIKYPRPQADPYRRIVRNGVWKKYSSNGDLFETANYQLVSRKGYKLIKNQSVMNEQDTLPDSTVNYVSFRYSNSGSNIDYSVDFLKYDDHFTIGRYLNNLDQSESNNHIELQHVYYSSYSYLYNALDDIVLYLQKLKSFRKDTVIGNSGPQWEIVYGTPVKTVKYVVYSPDKNRHTEFLDLCQKIVFLQDYFVFTDKVKWEDMTSSIQKNR